jgi:hypothetical protein
VIGGTRVESGLPFAQVGRFGDPFAEEAARQLFTQFQKQGLRPILDEFRPDNIGRVGTSWQALDPGMFR